MVFDQGDQVLPVPEFAQNLTIKISDIFVCLVAIKTSSRHFYFSID